MKLIDLNIWGGRVFKQFLSFLSNNSDIDIFCFQEVFDEGKTSRPEMKSSRMDIYNQISKVLPDHKGLFSEEEKNGEGIAMFIKRDLNMTDHGSIKIHQWIENVNRGPATRVLQWVIIKNDNKEYTISHFHGLWHEIGKIDVPERIKQSEKVKSFLDSVHGPKIVCGDLNLTPETKSLAILKDGMRELVTENKIQSTRSSLYLKEIKHADYMFISNDIKVNKFEVLKDTVSDHLPLYLEFS